MYELTLIEEISAAHRLPGSGGKCDRLHGHNWKVEVCVQAAELDESGMVMDFHELRPLLRQVLDELDHSFLNDLPVFQNQPPTAENLAGFIAKGLAKILPSSGVRVRCVRVWESETAAAAFQESESSCERPPGGRNRK